MTKKDIIYILAIASLFLFIILRSDTEYTIPDHYKKEYLNSEKEKQESIKQIKENERKKIEVDSAYIDISKPNLHRRADSLWTAHN